MSKFSLNFIKYRRYNIVSLDSYCRFQYWRRKWWAGDVYSNTGKEVDSLTSTAGYTQPIDKLIHFFSGGSSCIDLIFFNKPKIVSECGIDHSLFQTCHHNLIFAKTVLMCPLTQITVEKFGITKMLMLKKYKSPCLF